MLQKVKSRIGTGWYGNKKFPDDHKRSISAEQFKYICLRKEMRE